MKIAVIGAGAIGSLVAGYLKEKNFDALLVGHQDQVDKISRDGLVIKGVRGTKHINLEVIPALDRQVDLIILAVKTQDIRKCLKDNQAFIGFTKILTTQNGLQADNIVGEFMPKDKIISSIVMFGATYLEPGEIVHNFEGGWIIGKPFSTNDQESKEISAILNNIFPVTLSEDILSQKWTKLFVNLNNCLPAILGLSMQETFANLEMCAVSIELVKEALDIVDKNKIVLKPLPDFDIQKLRGLTNLPLPQGAKIFSGIMTNLSREPLYGSVLQSIKRNRPSEIDYINGEVLRLAKNSNLDAPLNRKLVAMVHEVEKTKKFFKPEEILL